VAARSLFTPLALERTCMRAGVTVNALAFLPVLWTAPDLVPLSTLAIFVPFLAVYAVAQTLRRRLPLLGVHISRAASSVYVVLSVATPLLYPREFPPADAHAASVYGALALALTGGALVLFAALLSGLRRLRGDGVRRTMPIYPWPRPRPRPRPRPGSEGL
jgi:hypothetical protein